MRRSTPDLDADVRLFHALADPTRLAIVRELGQTASICACDFTATCGVSRVVAHPGRCTTGAASASASGARSLAAMAVQSAPMTKK